MSAMSNRAGPLKYSVAWAPHAVVHEVVLNVLLLRLTAESVSIERLLNLVVCCQSMIEYYSCII